MKGRTYMNAFTDNDLIKAAAVLDALGNDVRLRIFRILVQNSNTGITPTDISKQMDGMPRNTLSFHLSLLSNVGLCSVVKNGKQAFYKRETQRQFIRHLKKQSAVFSKGK